MRYHLLVLAFVFTAVSCFPNGGSDEPGAEVGEIGVEVNLETASDFDPDLNFAQVLDVTAQLEPDGEWHFSVSVRHKDEGWDHYADLWEVVDPENSLIYGLRILAHPHDNEQPFTRSQSGIEIPLEVTKVLVRASCTKHGFEGRAVLVDLSTSEGEGFTVVR